VTVGWAVPLTSMVSRNASAPQDTLGVPGISGGCVQSVVSTGEQFGSFTYQKFGTVPCVMQYGFTASGSVPPLAKQSGVSGKNQGP